MRESRFIAHRKSGTRKCTYTLYNWLVTCIGITLGAKIHSESLSNSARNPRTILFISDNHIDANDGGLTKASALPLGGLLAWLLGRFP
jgi:hypothetical protein